MPMTSVMPLGSFNEINCWSNMPFSAKWPTGQSTEQKEVATVMSARKMKRQRTTYSTQQIQYLEAVYSRRRYINRMEREVITTNLDLSHRQVKIWFQNRRMKSKRKREKKVFRDASEEYSCNDSTLQSRHLNSSDQNFDDNVGPIQGNTPPEKFNYHLPGYLPPFQEHFLSPTYCPENMNFQQSAVLGVSEDLRYHTEYYPTYIEHNNFHRTATEILPTEANSTKDDGTTAANYYF